MYKGLAHKHLLHAAAGNSKLLFCWKRLHWISRLTLTLTKNECSLGDADEIFLADSDVKWTLFGLQKKNVFLADAGSLLFGWRWRRMNAFWLTKNECLLADVDGRFLADADKGWKCMHGPWVEKKKLRRQWKPLPTLIKKKKPLWYRVP